MNTENGHGGSEEVHQHLLQKEALEQNFIRDLSKLTKLRRALLARQWNVPASLIEDVPASSSIRVGKIVEGKGDGGWIKGALLGAALVSGIGGGALGLGLLDHLLNKPPPSTPAPAGLGNEYTIKPLPGR